MAGGAILCFDGAMQLGSVFDPKNSLFSFAYPTPRTGFFPLFQVSGYAADCPYALAAQFRHPRRFSLASLDLHLLSSSLGHGFRHLSPYFNCYVPFTPATHQTTRPTAHMLALLHRLYWASMQCS